MSNSEASPPHPQAPPWGPVATVMIGILAAVSILLAQIGVDVLLQTAGSLSIPGYGRVSVLPLGLAVSLESLLSLFIGSFIIWLAVGVRQHGYSWAPVRSYLGLQRFARRSLFAWAGLTLLYLGAMDAVSYWSGRALVPDFIIEAYATSVWPPLFWIAVGLGAPFFEELFFRGFLLAGFRKTPRRTVLAVVAISAVWAVIHLQYGWYELLWIFGLGLLFGAARVRSGSLWLPIILHALCNLLATLQVARMPAP